jgi:hypothetical protein
MWSLCNIELMYMEVIIFSKIFATLFTTKNINFTILISNIIDLYSPIRQHRMSSLSQWRSNIAKCPSNMHLLTYDTRLLGFDQVEQIQRPFLIWNSRLRFCPQVWYQYTVRYQLPEADNHGGRDVHGNEYNGDIKQQGWKDRLITNFYMT